ncbi:hypothetical protein H4S02_006878 [Coemansia sp. RSA 2611]|uniref:J domain-containing protein n=2 Tax=Coemansia TaxID=4863 RepID=A0A9W8GME1_9FUNG|nr:hypothetical protein LPJ60_004253 [Coemansia sp. RSA 2675]KAJ2380048.1 hypothetical protein H4S02_006878 [Coemansia sp. RSA 2611]KAJ2410379.1 hypothetical protein GGI10_004540 [Coemansia sp. RSA 2530]KAJ2690725.1 hypothetical protein IWW39_000527 [Coemansia spiralis]KAJ2696228.1 hypothetical protein H4218_004737 [Coemansia sp. IMI 209128]KAJ2779542.1 hypothetical protein GGI18_003919 [Coemansia linderi]
MRLNLPSVLLVFSLLFALVAAWEKLDHEIFELYDDIKRHEVTTDWYELLGIEPKSTVTEINRAYRQLSKKYHPDKLGKLPGKKGESEKKRFQRITLAVNILRDSEMRKRYNFFRKNGVPVWRGTGYLYRRWRPGFGTVVVGLLVFMSGMQYLFHSLSFWRARQRIEEIEAEERANGGKLKVKRGDQSVQQNNRRVRRQQKGAVAPASNSEDSGFEGEDLAGNHINTVGVINPYSVRPASISRVVIVSLPVWVANSLMVALGLRAAPVVVEDSKDSESVDDEGLEADDAQDIVRQAIENAANPPEPAAKKLPAVDPEVAAKKAAKKAAKAEARRRRMPVV